VTLYPKKKGLNNLLPGELSGVSRDTDLAQAQLHAGVKRCIRVIFVSDSNIYSHTGSLSGSFCLLSWRHINHRRSSPWVPLFKVR